MNSGMSSARYGSKDLLIGLVGHKDFVLGELLDLLGVEPLLGRLPPVVSPCGSGNVLLGQLGPDIGLKAQEGHTDEQRNLERVHHSAFSSY